MSLPRGCQRLLLWTLGLLFLSVLSPAGAQPKDSSEDYLLRGNSALAEDAYFQAIDLYEQGIAQLSSSSNSKQKKSPSQIVTRLSLETNLATAYSAVPGLQTKVLEHYDAAISTYHHHLSELEADAGALRDARSIVSQTALFYGMELQEDAATTRKAVELYGNAVRIDPELWAAWANLGSVFQDQLNNYDEALQAYNMAYEVLTEHEAPTDPPEEPRFILSQLQYRIGLCLSTHPDRKCYNVNQSSKEVSCQEMAAHAFQLAVQFDDANVSAKHMLASITADATMKKASNEYVKSLFDDYASRFEESLVDDLGYDGYARLRRAFDHAMQKHQQSTSGLFDVVLDAGCGTGLVGEQFRNISSHLIGVDLSAAILDEAEKLRPHLYDERIEGDVAEVIRAKRPISLIVAADSFIYFGDLDPLFDSIRDGLQDHTGYIAFTLENVSHETEAILTETKPDWRWQLTASGRFAHTRHDTRHDTPYHL